MRTERVRADETRLGDTLLFPCLFEQGQVEEMFVTSLELVGDDVEFNGGDLTTSVGNRVTRLRREA